MTPDSMVSSTAPSTFLAIKGVEYRPVGADALLRRNLLIWGLGGVIVPFIGIKVIDLFLTALGVA